MSIRSTVFLPHSLLRRSIDRHLREVHGLSRRTFLQGATTAGLALTASLGMPQLAQAKEHDTQPKPVPGGVSPLGISIHHFPVQPKETSIQDLTEPSQITDFNGFVGLNRIRGAGRGSGFVDPLAFQADMGFMKVGQTVLTTQIHDYSPPIAPNGLFWTVPIHPNNVKIKLKSARASMHAEGLAVPDAHDLANSLTHGNGLTNPLIPAIAPVPATVSFDVEWAGEISRATVVNEAQNFRGDFIKTGSTIKWSSDQSGFFFDSEAPDPSRLVGAVIGRERNGVFFNDKDDDGDDDDND